MKHFDFNRVWGCIVNGVNVSFLAIQGNAARSAVNGGDTGSHIGLRVRSVAPQ